MSKFFEAANQADPNLIDVVMERPPQAPPVRDGSGVQDEAAPEALAPADAKPVPSLDGGEPMAIQPPVELAYHRSGTVSITATSPVLPFDGLDPVAAERYRLIRTRILQHPRQPRVICISSSGIGDGKTLNAINIAGALALKQDLRVLLADCDFRRASIAGQLGIPDSPGMTDILEGRVHWTDAVVRVAEAPNLHIIPAGEVATAPPELLGSERWSATCEALREAFDFVIVDSPPIGLVADYDLIQSGCDSVILVVRQDHTRRTGLMKALDSMDRDKLLGIVMNSQRGWSVEKSYSYYPATLDTQENAGGAAENRPDSRRNQNRSV